MESSYPRFYPRAFSITSDHQTENHRIVFKFDRLAGALGNGNALRAAKQQKRGGKEIAAEIQRIGRIVLHIVNFETNRLVVIFVNFDGDDGAGRRALDLFLDAQGVQGFICLFV